MKILNIIKKDYIFLQNLDFIKKSVKKMTKSKYFVDFLQLWC